MGKFREKQLSPFRSVCNFSVHRFAQNTSGLRIHFSLPTHSIHGAACHSSYNHGSIPYAFLPFQVLPYFLKQTMHPYILFVCFVMPIRPLKHHNQIPIHIIPCTPHPLRLCHFIQSVSLKKRFTPCMIPKTILHQSFRPHGSLPIDHSHQMSVLHKDISIP